MDDELEIRVRFDVGRCTERLDDPCVVASSFEQILERLGALERKPAPGMDTAHLFDHTAEEQAFARLFVEVWDSAAHLGWRKLKTLTDTELDMLLSSGRELMQGGEAFGDRALDPSSEARVRAFVEAWDAGCVLVGLKPLGQLPLSAVDSFISIVGQIHGNRVGRNQLRIESRSLAHAVGFDISERTTL